MSKDIIYYSDLFKNSKDNWMRLNHAIYVKEHNLVLSPISLLGICDAYQISNDRIEYCNIFSNYIYLVKYPNIEYSLLAHVRCDKHNNYNNTESIVCKCNDINELIEKIETINIFT